MSTTSVADQETGRADVRRGVIRWLVRESVGVVFVAVTLFVPAGTLRWGWGWALVGVYAAWTAANAILLIPTSPELLAERGRRRKDAKRWDAALLAVIGVATIAKHLVAGFDYRFGWSAALPIWLHTVCLIAAASGYALVTWGMVANAYFSLVVRIQEDRGHQVATGGPYRFVRHPGYAGTFVFELATPLMLGSLWALIPGGLMALAMVVRTALEDRTLRAELPGYAEYAQRTRYRLLPGVW